MLWYKCIALLYVRRGLLLFGAVCAHCAQCTTQDVSYTGEHSSSLAPRCMCLSPPSVLL